MEKIKLKISLQKINYYFYFLIAISTVIVLIILSLFLYKNFYQTITQSEEVIILQRKVASDVVNMDMFNKILGAINNKTEFREFKEIKNPFD